MSARDLLTVYVRRGLLSETTFATLQQAKEELDQARMLSALAEAPALRTAIEAEIGLIKRVVERPTHISELDPLEVPSLKVAQVPEKIAKSLEPIGGERVDTKKLLTDEGEERI